LLETPSEHLLGEVEVASEDAGHLIVDVASKRINSGEAWIQRDDGPDLLLDRRE